MVLSFNVDVWSGVSDVKDIEPVDDEKVEKVLTFCELELVDLIFELLPGEVEARDIVIGFSGDLGDTTVEEECLYYYH